MPGPQQGATLPTPRKPIWLEQGQSIPTPLTALRRAPAPCIKCATAVQGRYWCAVPCGEHWLTELWNSAPFCETAWVQSQQALLPRGWGGTWGEPPHRPGPHRPHLQKRIITAVTEAASESAQHGGRHTLQLCRCPPASRTSTAFSRAVRSHAHTETAGYLISVTSDLSSFCSSSLAASRTGMTSVRAVSASAFSTAMILFCSSISMAFSSASFFFSSAVGGGAG